MQINSLKAGKLLTFFLSGLLLISLGASTASAQAVVPRKSYVTDLTSTLSKGEIAALNDQLRLFHRSAGPEIALLMIKSTNGEAIESYSLRTANRWGLGSASRNDGVLLLVAKKDRKLRIEVGKGLEGRLTDARAARIIRENITPFFKRGGFYTGIDQGLREIQNVVTTPGKSVTKEHFPIAPPVYQPPARETTTSSSGGGSAFAALVVIGAIVLVMLTLINSATSSGKSGKNRTADAVNQSMLLNSFNSTTTSSFTSTGGGFDSGGGSFGGGGSSGDW